jgi:two-component system, LytTR family, sensor kinase
VRLNGVDKAGVERHLPTAMDRVSNDSLALETGALQRARTRALLWLTLIFWGSNVAILSLGTALSGNPYTLEITGMRLVTTLLGLAFCYAIHRIMQHPRLDTIKRRAIALALIAPVAAEIFAWASYFAEAAVDPTRELQLTWANTIRTIAFWTWFFLAWAGLYLAFSYSFDVREEQQRSAALRDLAHTAQLRALHSQINPHFLFNSLNSVSSLMLDGKSALADEMVTKLARFLRMGLAADPREKIRLSDELALQRTYLEIEQLRYPDLKVTVELPDEAASALVPSLILQPVIENSVKYGVAGAPPPAWIAIEASIADRRLLLKVSDSGRSTEGAPGMGIGLANLTQRLRLLYGDRNFDVAAGRRPDGSFEVQLELPLELA